MSLFEPGISSNFLIDYIKDNPNCPLEDILNDDDLLESLSLDNEILFS